jgi:cell division septation protein DedD
MIKKINLVIFVLFISRIICAQNVVSKHEISKGSLPNEFNIKTTVSGLEDVDLGRITYFISNTHTYKPASSNPFFSKIEESFIKFYIMSIPSGGIITLELGIVLSGEEDFEFPVEFQYSKNEEKVVVDCEPLIIKNGALIASEDPTLNDKIQAESDLQAKKEEEEALLAKQKEQIKQEEIAAAKAKEDAALAAKIDKVRAIAKQEEENERIAKQKESEQKKQEEILATKAREDAALAAKIARVREIAKQEEEERIAKEKVEKNALEDAKKVSVTETQASTATGTKYGVQIFALSKYTEQKVRDFCKRNNLEYSKINTLVIKGITRVRYGSVNSKEEAEKLKKELLTRPQINGGYVVKL